MKNGKEKRGGTRQGSGAKPKYNEQTKNEPVICHYHSVVNEAIRLNNI